MRTTAFRSIAGRHSCPLAVPSVLPVASLTTSPRFFYSGLDDERVARLRSTTGAYGRFRGRDCESLAFEKRVSLRRISRPRDLFTDLPPKCAVVWPIRVEDLHSPVPLPAWDDVFYDSHLFLQPKETTASGGETATGFVRDDILWQLRKNSDTSRCVRRRRQQQQRQHKDPPSSRSDDSETTSSPPTPATSTSASCSMDLLVFVVEPELRSSMFRLDEAQVELITAYRNVFCEAAEASDAVVVDVIRIPVLALDMEENEALRGYAEKLTQQSVIKAFHRASHLAKTKLLGNPLFRVEVCVADDRYPSFVKTFAEDAWETPQSVLQPGRLNLYPGLKPPESMLELEGWVGKRTELKLAASGDLSALESSDLKTLDGRAIQSEDVYRSIEPLVKSTHVREMLRREAESATAAGLEREERQEDPTAPPLKPGLQY